MGGNLPSHFRDKEKPQRRTNRRNGGSRPAGEALIRAVLDTSVLISALVKGWWPQIGDAVESQRLVLISSLELLAEFLDVTSRPSKQRILDPTEAEEVADLLRRVTLASPLQEVHVCRDPNDDFLLALAAAGHADVLVTRDEDLLILGRFVRLCVPGDAPETARSRTYEDTATQHRCIPND